MRFAELRDPLAKPDLTAFASAIRAKMRKDPEYFLLIFIDVVEFKNQHFRASFHDVPEWFRRALGTIRYASVYRIRTYSPSMPTV